MNNNLQIGSLVVSKSGRDKDNVYLVVDIIDKDYVMLVDGKHKLLSKPKKKNIKHLFVSCEVSNLLQERNKKHQKVYDNEIFSVIKDSKLYKKIV